MLRLRSFWKAADHGCWPAGCEMGRFPGGPNFSGRQGVIAWYQKRCTPARLRFPRTLRCFQFGYSVWPPLAETFRRGCCLLQEDGSFVPVEVLVQALSKRKSSAGRLTKFSSSCVAATIFPSLLRSRWRLTSTTSNSVHTHTWSAGIHVRQPKTSEDCSFAEHVHASPGMWR